MLLSFGFYFAGGLAAAVSTLTIKKEQAHLYAQQEERSEILGELKMGDKLTPLANALGNEAWYLVQTPKGLTGWVRAADVEGTEALGKIFDEGESFGSPPVTTGEALPLAKPFLSKATSVPIEISGNQIIVPVELNRSIKAYLVMDTGAAITMVNRALAKKLRLVSDQGLILRGVGGTVKANMARLGSVKLGTAEVYGLSIAIHDYDPHPRAQGLLGLDFFSRFHTSIDSKKQLLTIAPR